MFHLDTSRTAQFSSLNRKIHVSVKLVVEQDLGGERVWNGVSECEERIIRVVISLLSPALLNLLPETNSLVFRVSEF